MYRDTVPENIFRSYAVASDGQLVDENKNHSLSRIDSERFFDAKDRVKLRFDNLTFYGHIVLRKEERLSHRVLLRVLGFLLG